MVYTGAINHCVHCTTVVVLIRTRWTLALNECKAWSCSDEISEFIFGRRVWDLLKSLRVRKLAPSSVGTGHTLCTESEAEALCPVHHG
jgi:hypothetical protein